MSAMIAMKVSPAGWAAFGNVNAYAVEDISREASKR
jgi:hypothetical protein